MVKKKMVNESYLGLFILAIIYTISASSLFYALKKLYISMLDLNYSIKPEAYCQLS